MKLKNYDYLLFSNIIITGLLQINHFNIIGLISVGLSILYFCILLFTKYRSKSLLVIFVFSLITGVVYYFLNPIFENQNISLASIVPAIFLLLELIHAITMPIVKRNWFSGVRTSLALKNDEVWIKVNNVGSIVSYTTLFPLFVLIFYLKDSAKLVLSILVIVLFAFSTILIALYIEKKYIKEMNRQEMLALQLQRKKETGG